MFYKSKQLLKYGIGTAYPCAAVAVGVGYNVFVREYFGLREEMPERLNITEDTLFDIASLSKLVSTTMIAFKFIDSGKISLNDKLDKYLDYVGNYGDCEIINLLTHTSGLPAGIPLYAEAFKNIDPLKAILDSEKCYQTGEKVIYSCMGYIVLQYVLEKVGGASLDELSKRYVFGPLNMKDTCYNPENLANKGIVKPIAATERYSFSGEWATGHVHDENAYFLGGAAGNAGVFSTLGDLISFAGMCSQKGKLKNGETYLSKEIFEKAIYNYTEGKGDSRGLGFQLKGNTEFPAGEVLPSGSYGHTGFTGTSIYVDSNTGLWGILLTNAVHYGRENRANYFALRKSFYNSIVKEYESMK